MGNIITGKGISLKIATKGDRYKLIIENVKLSEETDNIINNMVDKVKGNKKKKTKGLTSLIRNKQLEIKIL